jgi:hypothetical protein
VRWRNVEARSSCLNGKLGRGCLNGKLGITVMRYSTAPNKPKSMYYKEHGKHHFFHTRFASTYKSEAELADDPTFQEKHWLLTINGAEERAVSIGYMDDAVVRRLVKKHVPGVSNMVFLHECKPLSLKESYNAWFCMRNSLRMRFFEGR